MIPDVRQIARAHFRAVEKIRGKFNAVGGKRAIDVEVHFNPASLQYTLSNAMKPENGNDPKSKQYVSQTSAKLTMDLVFDTTHTGQDVRGTKTPPPGQPAGTDQMARLLKPDGPKGRQVPPLVEFSWGTYRFVGTVEQYKETIDYFSPEGVPLRSSVNLTLASQDVQFDSSDNPNAAVDRALNTEAVMLPTSTGPSGGPAGVSTALGDPRAARAIAAVNGSASLRFSGGADLAVAADAGITLSAAAAFSTGALAGFGIGGSMGGGVSAGFGAGASAGAGLSFGASAGAGTSGGAFAGLRGGAAAAVALPDAGTVLSARAGASASASAATLSSAVGVGGRALAAGSASLAADVGGGGASASLRFDA